MNNSNNMNMYNMNMNNMNNMNNKMGCGCNTPNMPNKTPDKRTLMARVYQMGFALTETVLFLDTHPSDSEAICFYNDIKDKYNEAVDMYSQYFGPLLTNNVSTENYWMWVATPMPWEVEGC